MQVGRKERDKRACPGGNEGISDHTQGKLGMREGHKGAGGIITENTKKKERKKGKERKEVYSSHQGEGGKKGGDCIMME